MRVIIKSELRFSRLKQTDSESRSDSDRVRITGVEELLNTREGVCGTRYLGPATGVDPKVGTGRPSGHPRPPGDGGDSFRWRLGCDEPDAGQA